MEELIINMFVSLGGSILTWVVAYILCYRPYQEHRQIYAKMMNLKRAFKDPKFTKSINPDIGLIEKQSNEIIAIINRINEMIDLHPKFSWLFNYKRIHSHIALLFEYNRNSIMLENQKIFENDYTMDVDCLLNKIKKDMNFQTRVLLLVIVLILVLFLIAKTWKIIPNLFS